MDFVSKVFATTYMGVCSTGRNIPCRFRCVNDNDVSNDYIVKFYATISSQIICEFVASHLGKKLGINVPDIAIVYADARLAQFIDHIEAKQNFLKDVGPHFGSLDIGPGISIMNNGYSLHGRSLEQAIDIFAFDMLTQNADRVPEGAAGKPNILFQGDELYAIDHELTFSFINLIGSPVEPWKLRNQGLAERHLFYSRLKQFASGNDISFDRFIQKLELISDDYVENLMQSLPDEWYNDRYISKITEHLSQVLSNRDKFHKGLLEVFI